MEVRRKPAPAYLPIVHKRSDPVMEPSSSRQYQLDQQAVAAIDFSSAENIKQLPRHKSSGKSRSGSKRPLTFLSDTTSIEDAESDDEPPLPQSVLSPVIESPQRQPPKGNVRYPAIPISASESPSVYQPVRQVSREQLQLGSPTDKGKGKERVRPKVDIPANKSLPNVPELGGTELRERQQVPDSSRDSPKPGSAKYNILVAPGLEGIENLGSPRSKASGEFTAPNTPTRRARQ